MEPNSDEKPKPVTAPNNKRSGRPDPLLKGLCSNPVCPTRPNPTKTEIVPYKNIDTEFCLACAYSVRQRWICPYCQVFGRKESEQTERSEWIQCSVRSCGVWVHQECEGLLGMKDIKNQAQKKTFMYYCGQCRLTKPMKKIREGMESKKVDKFADVAELRRTLVPKRKPQIVHFTYLFSENYQTIDKVMQLVDKNAPTLALSENEMREDFAKFHRSMIENESEDAGGASTKQGADRPETSQRLAHKKIMKKTTK